MYLQDHERELWIHWQYRTAKYLFLYIPPILLLLGTLGNVLTVIILSRKSMWRQSTYFYLAILAGTDTVVLYVGLLQEWIKTLCGKNLIDYANWTCKIMNVAGYTGSDYSGWVIIAVTVERYLAVCKPLKASSLIGNRERAVKVIFLLLLVMFGINMHFFWTVELVPIPVGEHGSLYQCRAGDEYMFLIDDVWPWVDMALYSFIPFFVILTLNTLIIRQVVKARKVRQQLQSDGGNLQYYRSRVSPNASANSRGASGAGSLTANQCSMKVNKPQSNSRPSADSSNRITVMLLIISFVFLALTLPMTGAHIWVKYIKPNDIPTAVTYYLIRKVTQLLMHLNHCTNFYLYCATGHKFRQQLRWIMVQSKHKCAAASSCGKGRANNRHEYEVRLANMHPDLSVWPPSRSGSVHLANKHGLHLELTALTQAQTDRRTPSPHRNPLLGRKTPAHLQQRQNVTN